MIYYWVTQRGHILLITLYRKSEVTDLTPKERKALGAFVKTLK